MEALEIFKSYLQQNLYPVYSVGKKQVSTAQATYTKTVPAVPAVLTVPSKKSNAESKMKVFSFRVKDKPGSLLTVIMPNVTLFEARAILRSKYKDRLLMVAECKSCMRIETKHENTNQ